MEDEWLHRIALTLIPTLGPVRIKNLIEHFGNATAALNSSRKEWLRVPQMTEAACKEMKNKQVLEEAAKEWQWINEHAITPLFLTDPNYPHRLRQCYDPPALLFYKGSASLNHPRMLSIIGTRNSSSYGKQVTEELMEKLKGANVTIISGLAFGIDAIAHRSAMQKNVPTIGVLAHGLNTIYPWQHQHLATEMCTHGGLLTEFNSSALPEKHQFPRRNRIVAGLSDATLVVETAVKGGSMITAELAFQYNRDVFAVPGKIYDRNHSGCLQLIKQNKAILYTSPTALMDWLGWQETKPTPAHQQSLFEHFSADETYIVSCLSPTNGISIDELMISTGWQTSRLAAILLQLELKQAVRCLPGKRFEKVI
jgi:DNA processing protein